ncbi:MAG: hypothetical protein RLQ12_02555 [Cyclobacteriaceae bacterium]
MSINGRFTALKGVDDVPFIFNNAVKMVRYRNCGPAGVQINISGSLYDLKPGDTFDYSGEIDGVRIPNNESYDASVVEYEWLNLS